MVGEMSNLDYAKGKGGLCWQSSDSGLTGAYYPLEEAKIPVWDAGFWLGLSLYDVAPMYKGWIRKFDSHITRFYNNTRVCQMEPQISKEQFKKQIIETVHRSKFQDANVWWVATWGPWTRYTVGDRKLGGPELRGPDHQLGIQIWVKAATGAFPPICKEKGCKVIIPSVRAYPHQCVEPRLKHFDRLNFHFAQLEVINAGADGFVNLTIDGHLSEGHGANVWLVKQGKLFTPSENALQGITAEFVFDLARELNLEAAGTSLTAWDLYTADEAFYSSSAGGIFPIIEVDGRKIGDGNPGAITKRLDDIYWKIAVDPRYAEKII